MIRPDGRRVRFGSRPGAAPSYGPRPGIQRPFDGDKVRLSESGMPHQPLSRLGKQLQEAIIALEKIGACFALIGGLALVPHKVVRATHSRTRVVSLVEKQRRALPRPTASL